MVGSLFCLGMVYLVNFLIILSTLFQKSSSKAKGRFNSMPYLTNSKVLYAMANYLKGGVYGVMVQAPENRDV
jgi:hypothetical protein